jgi:hypothetical protein
MVFFFIEHSSLNVSAPEAHPPLAEALNPLNDRI